MKLLTLEDVDSFHKVHPMLPTVELHGFLRSTVCTSCETLHDRDEFQKSLSNLNPAWSDFVNRMIETGALSTEDPAIRRQRGLRTNPDGDVDIPNAQYTTFRYPACPVCLKNPPVLPDGMKGVVKVDDDGAWKEGSNAGVLKPAVIMFGEAIRSDVKDAAEMAIDNADRLLVIGSSLATYSAWRLAKRAIDRGMPLGILNLGGTRGEESFFEHVMEGDHGKTAVRCNMDAQDVLPELLKALEKS